MKKICAVFLVAILMTIFKVDVLALNPACTQAEQMRLRNLAHITQITYEFEKTFDAEMGVELEGYKVDINGFQPEFRVSDEDRNIYFEYNGTSISTSHGFFGGVDYNLKFYATAATPCSGEFILVKNLSLLPYNKYSEDPLCKGHETYELCKKFTSLNIGTYDNFIKRMNKYIKSLEEKEPEGPSEEEPNLDKTILDTIVDFIMDNYFIILMLIIVFGTSGIIFIEVRKRRSIL